MLGRPTIILMGTHYLLGKLICSQNKLFTFTIYQFSSLLIEVNRVRKNENFERAKHVHQKMHEHNDKCNGHEAKTVYAFTYRTAFLSSERSSKL